MKYCNKKNGNVYNYHREVLNTTNKLNGQIMVMYSRSDVFFVREKREFLEKFVKIVEDKPKEI